VHVAGSETAAAACSRCGINLRVGLLLNELPFIALYYLLVSTLLAFGQGDIDSPGAWSVVGLAVVTGSGRTVGELTAVLERPANDVWVVAADDGAEHLLPATRDAVIAVDLEAGRVTVQDWLFEVEEAR
jgi:hypothetical protein